MVINLWMAAPSAQTPCVGDEAHTSEHDGRGHPGDGLLDDGVYLYGVCVLTPPFTDTHPSSIDEGGMRA